MLSCIVALFASCGAAVDVPGSVGEGGADGSSNPSDAPTYDQSCFDPTCLEDALDRDDSGKRAGGDDAKPEQDVVAISDASVLCGYHSGPLLPGADAGGPALQCAPGWLCVALNGAWACCTVEGTGGVSVCNDPFLMDAQ